MFRTSLMVTVARVLGAVVAIATQILLARLNGAEALGGYYMALSLAALLSMLATLGLPWIAPTVLTEAGEAGEGARAKAFFDWARRDILVAGAALAGVAALVVWRAPFIAEAFRLPLIVGAASAPLLAQMRMNGAMANARRLFVLAYVPELLVRPGAIFALVFCVWLLARPVSVPALLLANAALVALLVVGQWRLLRTRVGKGDVKAAKAAPDMRAGYNAYRRQALPMIVATLFISIFADLDILVAGLFLAPKDLAVFAATLRITMFLAFFIQAAHQIIMRDSAEALRGARHAEVSRIVGRVNTYTMAVSVAALGGAIVAGPYVLRLFGQGFAAGYTSLVILMCAQVVRAAAGPGVQLLTLSGKTRMSAPVFVVGTLALCAGNAALIPALGLTGAALAVLLVTALWTIWIGLLAGRQTGVRNLFHLR